MRQFRYLRDPLFLFAVVAFLVNRFVLEQIWTSGFVHNHVNDLLCVAFLVPVMLTLMKWCGLRRDDGPPPHCGDRHPNSCVGIVLRGATAAAPVLGPVGHRRSRRHSLLLDWRPGGGDRVAV